MARMRIAIEASSSSISDQSCLHVLVVRGSEICDSEIRDSEIRDSEIRDSEIRDSESWRSARWVSGAAARP